VYAFDDQIPVAILNTTTSVYIEDPEVSDEPPMTYMLLLYTVAEAPALPLNVYDPVLYVR